jgi:carbon-monoxide dehydrogenase medium subunit
MLSKFNFTAPRTVPELLSVLDDHREDGKFLAGGTDLIPNIRNGFIKPAVVIDGKKIPEASTISFSASDGLKMGLAVTINDVLRSRDAREKYPALCECAHELASHQVRNRATVAGNVVNASPCSDMAPALLCLNASALLRSSAGERIVSFRDFFTGVKKTVIKPGEYLESITIPAASRGARGSYLKLKRIAGHDLGIVGVMMLRLDDKILCAVSSAAPTPVLVDSVTPQDSPDEAAAKVLAKVSPISDVRGSKEYRRYIIGVFVKRLLSERGQA